MFAVACTLKPTHDMTGCEVEILMMEQLRWPRLLRVLRMLLLDDRDDGHHNAMLWKDKETFCNSGFHTVVS